MLQHFRMDIFRKNNPSDMSKSERLKRENEAQEAVFTLRVPLERADAVEGLLASLLAAMAVDGPVNLTEDALSTSRSENVPESRSPTRPGVDAFGWGYPFWGYPGYPMPYPGAVGSAGAAGYAPPTAPSASAMGTQGQASPAQARMPSGSASPGSHFVQNTAGGKLEPGVILKSLRRTRGLTQKAVAEIAQTSQSRISDYEAGVRPMPPAVAQAIARFFDVPISEFLK